MNREELVTQIQQVAEKIATTMSEVDDDWAPVIIFGDQQRVIGLKTLLFADDAEKEETIRSLPALLSEHQATLAGMVMSSWMAPGDCSGPEYIRPSEHPERQEILIVAGIDQHGIDCQVADIIRRSSGGPLLSDWRPLGSENPEGQVSIQSPWLDAVRAGLQGAER